MDGWMDGWMDVRVDGRKERIWTLYIQYYHCRVREEREGK